MGRCFFRIGRKLKTDQHFCKLGKIWIYIKQCTSCFFMDEHPQTAWALFSTIFAYLPRTWALRGTSWNLLWFVIPALLFRHGVPWTFFRVTASVDNFFPQCLVRNCCFFKKSHRDLSKHLVIPWNFDEEMRVQCHGFNGLYSDLWRGHLSGFGSSSLSGFGKQRLKDFQGWFPVPWASTRGKRCYATGSHPTNRGFGQSSGTRP